MVVMAIDQQDVDRRFGQAASCAQARETTADDNDPRCTHARIIAKNRDGASWQPFEAFVRSRSAVQAREPLVVGALDEIIEQIRTEITLAGIGQHHKYDRA